MRLLDLGFSFDSLATLRYVGELGFTPTGLKHVGVAVLEFSPEETTEDAVETIAETALADDGRCLGTDAWALDRRRRPQSSVGIGIRASVNRLIKSSRMLLFVLAEHSITCKRDGRSSHDDDVEEEEEKKRNMQKKKRKSKAERKGLLEF